MSTQESNHSHKQDSQHKENVYARRKLSTQAENCLNKKKTVYTSRAKSTQEGNCLHNTMKLSKKKCLHKDTI